MPFAFLLGNWKLIAIGLVVLAVGGYIWNCEHTKTKHAAFVAELRAQAEAQKKEVERITAENVQRKERTDAETKRLRSQLNVAAGKLRDSAGSPILPAAGPGADSATRACFDRAELSAALSAFARGTAEIAVSGDEARVSLDIAKTWAATPAR